MDQQSFDVFVVGVAHRVRPPPKIWRAPVILLPCWIVMAGSNLAAARCRPA